MIAQVGDRITIAETRLGDSRRVGVITSVSRDDGTPPYEVRWLEDGRTSLLFPGAEARIEPRLSEAGSLS